LQSLSKLEEDSLAENVIISESSCNKYLDESIINQLTEILVIPKEEDQITNITKLEEVVSNVETPLDIDKSFVPNSALLATSMGNLANAYDEIDDFDPLNSNIVVSEIEKFRIRQNVRDKEAEEQRKIKLNEKVKQVMLSQVNQAADILIQDAMKINEPNISKNHIEIHSNNSRNKPMDGYRDNRQDNRRDGRDNYDNKDRINNDNRRDRDDDSRRDRDGNRDGNGDGNRDGNVDKRIRYDMQDEEYYKRKRIETLEMLSSNGNNQKQTEEFEEKRKRRLEVLDLMKGNSSNDKGMSLCTLYFYIILFLYSLLIFLFLICQVHKTNQQI
jgi:hypothetical protein